MVSIENRPRMLKEFLRDDTFQSYTSTSSSSSSGFTRKNSPCKSKVQQVSSKSTKPSIVLLRSRSKKAISAVHKMINVVKFLKFVSVKSPSVLPKSISRKLPSYKHKNDVVLGDTSEVKVKVKDILRWKSFVGLVEDKSRPLDLPLSPNRSIITATTAASTTSCSKNSSWCDSDFTAEELPSWAGENEEFMDKKRIKNLKEEWSCEDDDEQQSPISVLDSPFRDVEEIISPFHPNLANIQRARSILTRKIQELEGFNGPKYTRKHIFKGEKYPIFDKEIEGKAKHLLSHFKESNSKNEADDNLILDFFMHELSMNINLHEVEILRVAKSWKNGEYDDDYEWDLEDKRDAYVKDMEKGICWNKFQHEQQEMSKEFEMVMLNELIDEVLVDLLN